MDDDCDELRSGNAKLGIKVEHEQTRLDSIPTRSTIAQFIKSGQVAFSSVDPQLLGKHNGASDEVQTWMLDRTRERLAAASELFQDDILILRQLLSLKYTSSEPENHTSTAFDYFLPMLLELMRSNLTCAVALTNYVLEAPDTEVPRRMKEDLLRAEAEILGKITVDMRDRGTVERQMAAYEKTKHENIPEPQPLTKVSAAALGVFVKHFYNLGLYGSVETMLANLQVEMARTCSLELHIVYLPFLQELISLMLIYGIPYTNATYSTFFESAIYQYFERFVGPEPAQQQKNKWEAWRLRAVAARSMLESFDHSYFQEILGERYHSIVLPAMKKLLELTAANVAS